MSYDGRTAECIDERPWINNFYDATLTNYWYVAWLDAWVNDGGNGVGSYPNTEIDMYSNQTHDLLATNTTLTNNGQSFENDWINCG